MAKLTAKKRSERTEASNALVKERPELTRFAHFVLRTTSRPVQGELLCP